MRLLNVRINLHSLNGGGVSSASTTGGNKAKREQSKRDVDSHSHPMETRHRSSERSSCGSTKTQRFDYRPVARTVTEISGAGLMGEAVTTIVCGPGAGPSVQNVYVVPSSPVST